MACAGAVAALMLVAAGAGLGYIISAPATPVAPLAAPERPRAAALLPFAVEQLGALSGRLFKLENEAGQLTERIRTLQGGPAKEGAKARPAGSGGPMLPPRAEQDAIRDLDALAERLGHIETQIALVSDATALQNLVLMRTPTRLPIENAELVSRFGNRDDPFSGRRSFHAGLDFAAGYGTQIHAAAAGAVAYAGFRSDFGWMIEIDHGNGLATRYGHASRLLVKAGDLVTPGEPIAMVGSTGRSTGPHLHFEVLRNGEATDPRRYLAGL